jgi:hypothetical protein
MPWRCIENWKQRSTYLFSVLGVGVLFAADIQATSSSGYQASLWDPWPDFSLLFFLHLTTTLAFFLRRENWSSLQCNHSLVRAVTPSNHNLPSHLRLCSLFVASNDSQELRWKYSNPPPHWVFSVLSGGVSFTATPTGPRAYLHVVAKEMNFCDGHRTSVVWYDYWLFRNLHILFLKRK